MIPLGRNGFTDALTGESYVWERNHDEETSPGVKRNVALLQPVAAGWVDVEPIRQQGAIAGDTMTLSGAAVTEHQQEQLTRFFRLSKTRTVIFTHADGTRKEVLITRYEPTRQRVVRGPKGGTRTWRYVLEMEVVNNL